jgi:hypothetical protein
VRQGGVRAGCLWKNNNELTFNICMLKIGLTFCFPEKKIKNTEILSCTGLLGEMISDFGVQGINELEHLAVPLNRKCNKY